MGETLAPPMSVAQARRRLADTSRLGPEQVAELDKVVAQFLASRPVNRSCVACGSMRWSEHTDAAGDATWACAGCHRPASLSADAWQATRAAEQARQGAEDARLAAAAPDPRAALAEALQRHQAAAEALARLETALPAARTALTAARESHAAAELGMRQAEQFAIERAAGQRTAKSDLPVDAARGKLRVSEDQLQAARGASALLADKMHYANNNLINAQIAVRQAALTVLASESLEGLIAEATEARAAYIASTGALAWLLRQRAVPAGDVRPHQLIREASDPPSLWPEAAAAAEAMHLAQRLAQLEEAPSVDPPA